MLATQWKGSCFCIFLNRTWRIRGGPCVLNNNNLRSNLASFSFLFHISTVCQCLLCNSLKKRKEKLGVNIFRKKQEGKQQLLQGRTKLASHFYRKTISSLQLQFRYLLLRTQTSSNVSFLLLLYSAAKLISSQHNSKALGNLWATAPRRSAKMFTNHRPQGISSGRTRRGKSAFILKTEVPEKTEGHCRP